MQLLPAERAVRSSLRSSAFFAVLAGAVTLTACTGAGRQFAARVDDYEAYRHLRTATTLEEKLARAATYLRTQPDGRWRKDVRQWFVNTENRYFLGAGDDVARLRRYLQTLPRGPHAKAAAARIVEIEDTAANRDRDERAFVRYAEDIEMELAEAAQNRRRLVSEFTRWTRLLAQVRSFSKPTSELDTELIFAFRNSDAPAACRRSRCTRALSIRYAIPDGGKQSPRQALMDIVIELDDVTGGVVGMHLTGPDLFSRVGEAIQLSPVRPSDPQARAEAIGRAVELARALAGRSMPAASCSRDAIAPTVIENVCDGVRFEMTAAPTPAEEDRIEIRPVKNMPEPRR